MKKIIITLVLFAISGISFATVIIVDINGAGQFTSIQLAIDNSLPGDTIQVWPGTYNGAININKNIILQGSGYENTIITAASSPTVTMSIGKIKWFFISCTMGEGIKITSGSVVNCVIKGCSGAGIWAYTGIVYIQNCVILNNQSYGIYSSDNATVYAINTISRDNTGHGFFEQCYGNIFKNYCNGSNGSSNGYNCNVDGNQGCIDTNPIFISSTDYHLSSGSPCFNTGQPSLSDPDGSVSDMGYFGGPDCPIFPVVYEMIVTPNGNNINVQAKARANY